MTPTYIGVMPGRMPALKPLDALDGKAEPVLFLLYRILVTGNQEYIKIGNEATSKIATIVHQKR